MLENARNLKKIKSEVMTTFKKNRQNAQILKSRSWTSHLRSLSRSV